VRQGGGHLVGLLGLLDAALEVGGLLEVALDRGLVVAGQVTTLSLSGVSDLTGLTEDALELLGHVLGLGGHTVSSMMDSSMSWICAAASEAVPLSVGASDLAPAGSSSTADCSGVAFSSCGSSSVVSAALASSARTAATSSTVSGSMSASLEESATISRTRSSLTPGAALTASRDVLWLAPTRHGPHSKSLSLRSS